MREEDSRVAYGKLKNTNLYSRPLTVTYLDTGHTEESRAYLGTAGFHAHAELQGYFWMKDKLKDECIII